MEHLNKNQFESYRQSRLSPAELLLVSEHLGDCNACRLQIEAYSSDISFFALHSALAPIADQPILHLTEQQTALYVDQEMDAEELQVTADHLSSCATCLAAVADLQVFRNAVAPSLEHDFTPKSVAAPTHSVWQRFTALTQSSFGISPIPAFGVALLLVLIGITGWIIWRSTRPRSEVAVVPGPTLEATPNVNSALATPTATVAPSPVPVLAQLNDGNGQVTLEQNGKLTGAENLPVSYREIVKDVLTTGRIDKSSQLNGLSRPSSALMGPDGQKPEFMVSDPVGIVLSSDRPTFRWTSMGGAASYVVEVYDDQFKLVATSLNITGESWTAPQSLPRGKVYSWQVKASKEGQEVTSPRPPAPQAKFRVLDQAKANELARAKRVFPSSHLTLGLLYADAGLLRDAEQEFRLLQRANPDSELARNLLRQIQAMRR